MIEQLKQAGLGYRTNDTADRIGDIPLREVVYRVHPLPPSLKPLIWDFGSMDNNTGIPNSILLALLSNSYPVVDRSNSNSA